MLNELSTWMSIPATSEQESDFPSYLARELTAQLPWRVERQPIGKQGENLFFYDREPCFVFCTHMDTVPPYIPPERRGDTLFGRGACDAKGQILVMKEACKRLMEEGGPPVGLLLLDREETGSAGARFFAERYNAAHKPSIPFVVVGEPTENKLITAGKGIMCFQVEIRGKAAHSGYPQWGDNAMDRLTDCLIALQKMDLPADPVLGPTTYNIGHLQSTNPSNIICDHVTFELYFRTTHATHSTLRAHVETLNNAAVRVTFLREDCPLAFYCPPSLCDGNTIPLDTVAFGSDAPVLTMFDNRMLYGPGSITRAHTSNEFLALNEAQLAIEHLILLYHSCIK